MILSRREVAEREEHAGEKSERSERSSKPLAAVPKQLSLNPREQEVPM
jgi:hypothetical protein